jgi:competence protein ComEC
MNGTRLVKFSIALLLPVFFYLCYSSSSLLDYPFLSAVILGLFSAIWQQVRPQSGRTGVFLLGGLFFAYVLFGYAKTFNTPWFAFPQERVISLEGTLVEDSSLTKSNKQLLRLSLDRCTTRDGSTGGARGTLSVLCPLEDFFVSGSTLSVEGAFSEDQALFFAESYEVEQVTRLGYLRQRYMKILENRLFSVLKDNQSRSLSMMLLLGRSSDEAFPLKELGMQSGCAYLLALSGMHLQFFSVFSTFLFVALFGKRHGRLCSFSVPVLYVLLVGPKPSLIRALGMQGCSLFLTKNTRSVYLGFYLTALAQAFLFPQSLQSLGCLLSYAAFAGLLSSSLWTGYCPKWTKTFVSSAFAILFTAPLCLEVTGAWQLSALLLGPVAAALVGLDMAFSVLALLLGGWVSPPVIWCSTNLFALLEMGSRLIPFALSFREYWVFLVALLTCLTGIGYAKRALQKKRRRSYELEFRIRFPGGHHQPS